MIIGWYYLHTNGELIYKPDSDGIVADLRDSDFVRGFWPLDPHDRMTAWNLLVEAEAAGANPARISELAEKWRCNNADAVNYAERLGVVLGQDGDQFTATRADFVNLQKSPAGFGDSYLLAMGDLAANLGYKPSKMWGAHFAELLKTQVAETGEG